MLRDKRKNQTAQEAAYNAYMQQQKEETQFQELKKLNSEYVKPKDVSNVAGINAYNHAKQIAEQTYDYNDEDEANAEEVSIPSSSKPIKQIDSDYDFVNHPKHYTNHVLETKNGTIEYETIEYLESLAKRLEKWLSPDEIYDVVSGAKYLDSIRGEKPDGDKSPREKIAEDCDKIAWYLHRASWLIRENNKKKNL